MRRPLAIAFFTAAASAVNALAAQSGPSAEPTDTPGLQRFRLADGVYMFKASSEIDTWTSSNTVVFIGDDAVLVFDPNARASVTKRVIAEIRKLTTKPVRYLVNSHWHLDHHMGNREYAAAYPGLQIVTTTETREFMRRMPPKYFADNVGIVRRRAALDSAVRNGKLADGRELTPQRRDSIETALRASAEFAAELGAPNVLPNVAFSDSLRLWVGGREFRLFSATGDAAGSAVLYAPAERILATGDVLVRQEDGTGAQPWTTNNFLIRPWLASLRDLERIELRVIVPGQGPPLFDKEYLRQTIAMYDAIVTQVDAAMERAVRPENIAATVKLDAAKAWFTKGDATLGARFDAMTASLIRRAIQEARDGVPLPPA